MREVAIVGIGTTKFGELWDRSFREIGIEAGLKAMNDAKITSSDLDALYAGTMSTGSLINQENVASLLLDYSGLASDHLPAIRIEAGEASGALAFHQAYIAVASGYYNIVVVGGAEKLTDVSEDMAREITSATSDQEWESFLGSTQASQYALIAKRHMHQYNTPREAMAQMSVISHANASLNPTSHMQNKITIEDVLKAPPVATPLGMLDCAPMSDGAAAVILCPLDIAKKFTDTPVKVSASVVSTDTVALFNRRDITSFDSTILAAKKAYDISNKSPDKIDVAEINDNYSIAGLLSIEDLMFSEKGKASKNLLDGKFALGDRPSINTSGGLKGHGQPYGAVGVSQIVEAVSQLRGEAGKRQVSGATVGLTQTVGGIGSVSVVNIFERVN
ncbi:MAG: thiolase domain-containing protein [Thermoplasmata archaeon]